MYSVGHDVYIYRYTGNQFIRCIEISRPQSKNIHFGQFDVASYIVYNAHPENF